MKTDALTGVNVCAALSAGCNGLFHPFAVALPTKYNLFFEIIYVNPSRLKIPFGVTTITEPLVPLLTTAVMVLSFTTLKEVAANAPNPTATVPVNPDPLIVTTVPLSPVVGLKEVKVGVDALSNITV